MYLRRIKIVPVQFFPSLRFRHPRITRASMSVMLNSIPVSFLAISGLAAPCVSQAFLDAHSLDSVDYAAHLRSVTYTRTDGCITENLLCSVIEDSPVDVLFDAAWLFSREIVGESLHNLCRRLLIFGWSQRLARAKMHSVATSVM
jgi:hypothetical protein